MRLSTGKLEEKEEEKRDEETKHPLSSPPGSHDRGDDESNSRPPSWQAWLNMNEERRKRAEKYRNTHYLPRRVVTGTETGERGRRSTKVEMISPGKQVEATTTDSRLFHVLKDAVHPSFGLGVCMYFKIIKFIGCLALVCGVLNLPMALHFASNSYDSTRGDTNGHLELAHTTDHSGVWWMPYSALCKENVPVCLDADCSTHATEERIDGLTGRRHNSGFANSELQGHKVCHIKYTNAAYFDLAMIGVILSTTYLMWRWSEQEAERVDLSVQTAQDYSVIVQDPDADAKDPEEWRQFFSQFGDVFMVTVCLGNGPLLRLLEKKHAIERQMDIHGQKDKKREAKQRASYVLSGGGNSSSYFNHAVYNFDESMLSWLLRWFLGMDKRPLHVVHAELTDDISVMVNSQNCSLVSKVIIIFSSESAQRKCLAAMSVGLVPAWLDWKDQVRPEHLFRNRNLLQVEEAPEPSDLIYENLHITTLRSLWAQSRTWALTISINGAVFYMLQEIDNYGYTLVAALLIPTFSDIIASVLEVLVRLEGHHTKSGMEVSYFTKLQASRWFITCFCFWFIYDFTETNSDAELYQIYQVMLADAFFAPIKRALDLDGFIRRRIMAPRAKTDERAVQLHQPSRWFLAERYAGLTTSFMLACFYGSLVPLGYFFSAFSAFLNYWCDKYCLMRVWQHKPGVDASLKESVVVAVLLIVCTHFIFTSYFFAGYPFDLLCETDSDLSSTGSLVASTYGLEDGAMWKVCDQRLFSTLLFGSSPHWTRGQSECIMLFRIATIIAAASFVLWYCGSASIISIQSLFFRRHKTVGDIALDETGKPYLYHELKDGQGYIPEMNSRLLHHALQACSAHFQTYLFSHHLDGGHEAYKKCNLFFDSDLDGVDEESKLRIFSQAAQFIINEAALPNLGDGALFAEAASSKVTGGASPTKAPAPTKAAPPLKETVAPSPSPEQIKRARAAPSAGYRALLDVSYRRSPDYENYYCIAKQRVFVREGDVVHAAEGRVFEISGEEGIVHNWIEVVPPRSRPAVGLFLPLCAEDGKIPWFVERSDEDGGDTSSIDVVSSSDEESVEDREESAATTERCYARAEELLSALRPPESSNLRAEAIHSPLFSKSSGSPEHFASRRIGVSRNNDVNRVVVVLTKAARGGHAKAQLHLGHLYANGDLIPKDEEQAVSWFEQAIATSLESSASPRQIHRLNQREVAEVRYSLGTMHFNGRGTPQDKEKAVKLWRQARLAGDTLAARALEQHETRRKRAHESDRHTGADWAGSFGRDDKQKEGNSLSRDANENQAATDNDMGERHHDDGDYDYDDFSSFQGGLESSIESVNPLYQTLGITKSMWGGL
jgi:hypothetical protein